MRFNRTKMSLGISRGAEALGFWLLTWAGQRRYKRFVKQHRHPSLPTDVMVDMRPSHVKPLRRPFDQDPNER